MNSCRDFRQFAHRGTVCVRNHRPEVIKCIVQVVHAPPLARIDPQPRMLDRLPGSAAAVRDVTIRAVVFEVGVQVLQLVRIDARVEHVLTRTVVAAGGCAR